jgi:hypothetical protein
MARLNSFHPSEAREFRKVRHPPIGLIGMKLDAIFCRLYREHGDREGCASWSGDGDGDAAIFSKSREGRLCRVVTFRRGYVTELWGRKEPA